MAVKRIENIYDVTQRLLGEIEPQGESNIDAVRLQNLEDTIMLAESLIDDIVSVARHKNRQEASMKCAVRKAHCFIYQLVERFREGINE